MGRVASRKNVMSPWRGYRDKDGLFRLLERNHYLPQELRLCRACFLFLPRSNHYWNQKMASLDYDSNWATWCDIINWFDPTSYLQHRCPLCCLRVYTSYMSEKTYLEDNDTKAVAQGRKICPCLARRMKKP
ncbi:hypothetical protein A1O1_01063 [Capronia coronata CBS 617.96]|uniref:Uncharacterized protein n=1 Tax=Capronia coronata CBS 617.96 TaxID=1182541 RepID=W9YTU9_9EURO|nr:uncharacterized protein A1O1_01063 [Capronia coronata CBS 617.96]EXJ95938.1 hypothetical protein A1O1_01063 [Capronia coronata CBS 617.96]